MQRRDVQKIHRQKTIAPITGSLFFAVMLACALQIAGCRKTAVRAKIGTDAAPSTISLSCNFDRASVIANSGETIPVHVRATSPTPYKLAYFWTAAEGTFKGTGPDMEWNPHHAPAGTYVISVRVDDGHRGEANCSMTVQVVAANPR